MDYKSPKFFYFIFGLGIFLCLATPLFAQGNAHTPEQIAAKLRQLEAMTAEKIKEDFKQQFNEDLEALNLERMTAQRRERIERYLNNVEQAQERSFNEIRNSVENQTGEARATMEQQLEKAESFWQRNFARIREMFESSSKE